MNTSTHTGSKTARATAAALVACTLGIGAINAKEPPTPDRARLEAMLPQRTDSPADWQAGVEPLHSCGEPRLLPPCVPPPPCHPAYPPRPFDLIGVAGMPTRGPIYRGPCQPKTGTHDCGPLPRVHRVHDRAFDWFYRAK